MVSTTLTSLTKDLQAATADLQQVNPWIGLGRFSLLGATFLGLVTFTWSSDHLGIFIGGTVIAAVFYAFWLICTHDMAHQTLTGWVWFDQMIVPRLISWPMLWPHGLYAELHRLHHGWNGVNLRDPERVQWTWADYQRANPLVQWYVRHQWAIDILGLGGLGLILKTFGHAIHLQSILPRLRCQFILDLSGILLAQGILVTIALLHGQIFRYLLFWLILERVMGVILQTRDHLEHYGLWGKAGNYQLTQLYACRNLKTKPLITWLMGGLPYHAVHHAFPTIPFNQLPQAFDRSQIVLQQHGLPPMAQGEGYFWETLYWNQHPALIAEGDRHSPV